MEFKDIITDLNDKQFQQLRKAQKEKDDRLSAYFKAIYETEAGKAVLDHIIYTVCEFETAGLPVSDEVAQMAFHEGKRYVGRTILVRLKKLHFQQQQAEEGATSPKKPIKKEF